VTNLAHNLGLSAAWPEIFLGAAACVILIVDLLLSDERRQVSYWLTQIALLVAAWLTWASPDETPVQALSGMFVTDKLADALKLFAYLAASLTLFYSRGYLAARGLFRGEMFVLTLTSVLGMMVMISAASFVSLYLGLELMSLSLYALIALQRDSSRAVEAAMKYFVLGAIASGLLLYGMSMLYGATGTLDITGVADAIVSGRSRGVILVFGLVFVVSAIAFKIGAVPYHMWIPDVYDGAPTAVTLLVGSAPKLAAFAFAMRLLVGSLSALAFDWQGMLVVLCVLSMVLGNLVAIAQTSIKRMLAYSTIANIGFIVLGFVAGTPEGYSAALYYTLVYVLVAAGSFGVILLAASKGFEADRLDDYKGLYQRDPMLALAMMVLMFSTAGVPPFVGFWAKLRIFQVLWESQHLWLVVIAAAMSVVGAYYYLRVIKLMYFDPPAGALPPTARSTGVRFALGLNALAVLVLGLLPGPLLDLCARLIH
jgi:NADH-quinone oxidoreductase subunit N